MSYQKSKNESNKLVNKLELAHQSPNKTNSSKSPSSPHLLDGTPTYHQDINMNTSGTKKNSCKTNKNIPEPEKLQTQTRISNRHLWETNSQKLNTKAGICEKSKK